MTLKVDIITLFPELIEPHLNFLPFAKAISNNVAVYTLWDLKKYSTNNYGSVDDKPFGGGVGMILAVEPIHLCLLDIFRKNSLSDLIEELSAEELDADKIQAHLTQHNIKVILTKASGKTFEQKDANLLAKEQHLIIICGRYEGVDERVAQLFCNHEYSIGKYVLSGGELPTLVMLESITRLLEGILDKPTAIIEESYTNSTSSNLEHPQYTRPADYKGNKVPEILLSGDHKRINDWKLENQSQAN